MSAVPTETALGPLNPWELKHASQELWLAGDATLLQRHPRVAVVGTRNPSARGQLQTQKLVRSLVRHGAIIVSGLAAGVDTIAHTEAIQHGGRTIAVLGTPLDQCYPQANAALQRRIGEEHLLVSEFPPTSPAERGNFPRRNRTMALIADASVIVEAGPTSGTISQGWEALRLGRPLFLLRSLVESGLPWPADMVAHGAMPLDQIRDLLACLPHSERFAAAIPF